MSEKKKLDTRALLEGAAILGVLLIVFTTGLGTVVQSRLQQAVLWTGLLRPTVAAAGEQHPDADLAVPLVTLDGERFHLADFAGKTIFINVWATWCPPCLAEMPNIHRLYQDVASDAIVFVMINVDDEPEAARRYLEDKGYTFPVYRLTRRLPAVYDYSVLPTTYVVAPDGKLVVHHAGMAQYNTDEFKAYLRQLGTTVR